MGWWINLIVALVRYGPKLYTLVKEIIDLIKEVLAKEPKAAQVGTKRELSMKYNHAMAEYKKKRDPAKLKELRDELKKHRG